MKVFLWSSVHTRERTAMLTNVTNSNCSTQDTDVHYNFPVLVFGILLIIVIIGGNTLVCLSVYTEKALKTTTNYFIVSLAVADLMLAVLVLPLYVYSEFQGGIWSLNMMVCDGLMTMDVMLCTASIFNLCAISLDRFIAVAVPLHYNRKHVDNRQIILLSGTWLLAFAVASPILFGINNVPDRDQSECKLEDDNYVVYSSVCSFFIPCPIMLLLYCRMFYGLRQWEEARKARLLKSIQTCRTLQAPAARATVQKPSVSATQLQKQEPRSPSQPQPVQPPRLPRVIEKDLAQARMEDNEESTTPEFPLPLKYRNSVIQTVSYPDVTYSPSPRRKKKGAKLNGRERKAMKVLPVIVGAFLFCWTPFFVVHTTRAMCESCDISPYLMSTVTWLGYVNSALNPIIYTVFNTEFRKFFRKFVLTCW
ncbi:dopamine receptor D4b [Sardina pilchardus]|uniref:dopamine receptor D4b n=1 Tax=Sardina pilchardus TaxID=27697 RepID=UPI002E106233